MTLNYKILLIPLFILTLLFLFSDNADNYDRQIFRNLLVQQPTTSSHSQVCQRITITNQHVLSTLEDNFPTKLSDNGFLKQPYLSPTLCNLLDCTQDFPNSKYIESEACSRPASFVLFSMKSRFWIIIIKFQKRNNAMTIPYQLHEKGHYQFFIEHRIHRSKEKRNGMILASP